MKILVLTTTFPRWQNDAVPAFVYELSKQLQESGLEMVVLMPHCEGSLDYELLDGIKVYRFRYFFPSKYQKLVNGNGILPNLKTSHLTKIQIPILFVSEFINAYRIIRKEKIDCIHAHWLVPNGLIGAIISHFFKIRHIITEHGAGLIGLQKIPMNKKIFKFIFNNTEEIMAVSNKISDDIIVKIKKSGPTHIPSISIIPMGVSLQKFQSIEHQENDKIQIDRPISILFIGRIAEKKGLMYLLNAVPDIISAFSDVRITVCGEGPDKLSCEKKSIDLNIEKNVKFEGRISESKKIEYLRDADILVIPSIVTADGDTEGVPVVLLEGLAAGKAIIASKVGGIPEIITDGYNGFLIQERNSELISRNVIKLIKDPLLRKQISQNAYRSSELYDWKCIGDRYLQILKGGYDRL